MESVKRVTFRNVSLLRARDIDQEGLKLFFKRNAKHLKWALWAINCCGMVILCISLCVLASKTPASSIGLLWWTFFVHLGITALWSTEIVAPERNQCWGEELEALQSFRIMSPTLLMLLCDRAAQISAWTSTENAAGAARGTLAGGVMCLLSFLPYLLMKEKVFNHDESQLEAKKCTVEDPSSLKPQLGPCKTQPSDPEMSFVDLGTGQNNRPSCHLVECNTNSSSFRAYLNPMNMGKSEEGLQERGEDASDERTDPAFMPQVYGYPQPPEDLPASPSPTTRVCVPAAAHANQQKSSLATASGDHRRDCSGKSVARVSSQPGSQDHKPTTSGRPEQHTASTDSSGARKGATTTIQNASGAKQEPQDPDALQSIQEESSKQLPYTVHPPENSQHANPPGKVSTTPSSQLPIKYEGSLTMNGAQQARSAADVGPKEITNLITGSKLPSVPVLASNPLADSQEQDNFQSPQAALPGTHPGALLKSTAFLNQGDSEDTDSEFDF